MKDGLMRRTMLASLLALGVTGLFQQADAAGGNAANGAKSALYCAYCHGPDGNSTLTGTPRLAGQSAESFVAKMKLYKANQKVYHPMMAFLTGGLSNQDILDLGAFYASQPVTQSLQPYAGPPPLK